MPPRGGEQGKAKIETHLMEGTEMQPRRFRGILILAVSFLAAGPIAWRSKSVSMAAVDERESLMQADRDFDRITAETGLEGWVSYFAENGRMFPTGGEIVSGKQAIHEAMAPAFATPGFSLRWKPLGAEVSRSGDLGYTYGTYVAKDPDPKGELVEHHGKYVSIWRKQPDGSWKVGVDIGNASPPPPAL
jgi:ketosteroid isomerase-like protein